MLTFIIDNATPLFWVLGLMYVLGLLALWACLAMSKKCDQEAEEMNGAKHCPCCKRALQVNTYGVSCSVCGFQCGHLYFGKVSAAMYFAESEVGLENSKGPQDHEWQEHLGWAREAVLKEFK